MLFIKCIVLLLILLTCSIIGIKISQKYKERELELKEMKTALNMFKSKIKYTYEPIPDTFLEISRNFSYNISNIFKTASIKMQEENAGMAWSYAIDSTYCNMNNEDKNVLKSLSKMLGSTGGDGANWPQKPSKLFSLAPIPVTKEPMGTGVFGPENHWKPVG